VVARIHLPANRIAEFCQRNYVKRLALFGSVLRDDFGPHSDIDVLVEFQPGAVPGLLGLARMERELSAIFDGRPVDIGTAEALRAHLRQDVLDNAVVQYEER
jgi:predicted nucleotidyltransferase